MSFRLDRLLTMAIVEPFGTALEVLGVNHLSNRLPVLMYHSISDDRENGTPPYYRVCTSALHFSQQMQWLRELGYRGVSLAEGMETLRGANSTAPEEKLVAITFDDGFRNFYTGAAPALQRLGFTATMYLPTAYIGDTRLTLGHRECLTWMEVRELAAEGIEFGSHTITHPRLADLPWPEIQTEVAHSKLVLEQRLGTEIASFAYPYAFPSANHSFATRFRQLLVEIGYKTAVTTSLGCATPHSDPLQLPRLPANSADDRYLMTAKLRGHYDWLAGAQTINKRMRRLLGRDRAPNLEVASESRQSRR